MVRSFGSFLFWESINPGFINPGLKSRAKIFFEPMALFEIPLEIIYIVATDFNPLKKRSLKIPEE
ncbi:hypothetical protein GCM10022423_44380 [Flavobacterium ginsengiterrae]|uniref:Uncharacterized protein n=1 Tax=Flavobacterium ginsengiterrae TaxID=871695 RepID=A0ABP7H2J1_9FLAO